MSYAKLRRETSKKLSRKSPTPDLDSKLILKKILELTETEALITPQVLLNKDKETALNKMVSRYLEGEPLAYILGEIEFYGLEIKVTPDVLIPRPETEGLVEITLEYIRSRREQGVSSLEVLEIGVGSGCIGSALLSNTKNIKHFYGIDISSNAIKLANYNMSNNLANLVDKPSCVDRFSLESRSFWRLLERGQNPYKDCNIVISNPPYLKATEKLANIQKEVLEYEPNLALFGGTSGLVFYEGILELAKRMKKLPTIMVEIAPEIADECLHLFTKLYGDRVHIRNDLFGRERFLIAESLYQ